MIIIGEQIVSLWDKPVLFLGVLLVITLIIVLVLKFMQWVNPIGQPFHKGEFL